MAGDDIDVRYLKRRIVVLERMVVGAYCLAVGIVIIVGLFTPFLVEHAGEDDEVGWSVVNFAFPAQPESEQAPEAIDFIFVAGFIGLVVVAVLLLFVLLLPAARATLTNRWLTVARVLTVLGIIGAVVVMLLTLVGMGNGAAFRFGGVILLIGMLALLPLLSNAARPLVVTASERPEHMR